MLPSYAADLKKHMDFLLVWTYAALESLRKELEKKENKEKKA